MYTHGYSGEYCYESVDWVCRGSIQDAVGILYDVVHDVDYDDYKGKLIFDCDKRAEDIDFTLTEDNETHEDVDCEVVGVDVARCDAGFFTYENFDVVTHHGCDV